jgi:hypothetical protein
MGYGSFQSWVSHDIFGEKLCLVTVEHPMPGSFLGIFLNTPGSPQTKLTYALELSMEPYDALFRSYIATSGLPGVSYESAEVGFWPTSDGTQLALVELRGTDGAEGWGHTLSFHRGQASVGMTYFNWLNLVPL